MKESKVDKQPGTSECLVSLARIWLLPLCGRAETHDLHPKTSRLPGCNAAAGSLALSAAAGLNGVLLSLHTFFLRSWVQAGPWAFSSFCLPGDPASALL